MNVINDINKYNLSGTLYIYKNVVLLIFAVYLNRNASTKIIPAKNP